MVNEFLLLFVANIPSIVALSFAGVLAYKGKEPKVWGWFLFAGIIMMSLPKALIK